MKDSPRHVGLASLPPPCSYHLAKEIRIHIPKRRSSYQDNNYFQAHLPSYHPRKIQPHLSHMPTLNSRSSRVLQAKSSTKRTPKPNLGTSRHPDHLQYHEPKPIEDHESSTSSTQEHTGARSTSSLWRGAFFSTPKQIKKAKEEEMGKGKKSANKKYTPNQVLNPSTSAYGTESGKWDYSFLDS